MSTFTIYEIVLGVAGIVFFSLAAGLVKLNENNVDSIAALSRSKLYGGILSFLCLLWCIPQAKPIVWDWLVPWLLPLAIIATLLGIFFLEFLFARAVGGLFIILAYYFLHGSFAYYSVGSVLLAVLCWILGIIGLFFSGKPYLLRDLLKQIAKKRKLKLAFIAYFCILGLNCLVACVDHILD